MLAQKTKVIFLWFLIFIQFVNILAFINPQNKVKAQTDTPECNNKAQFIDRISICYKGRIWTDDRPYDDTHNYKAGPRSGVCSEGSLDLRHSLEVDEFDSSNPTATVVLVGEDEFGNCGETDRFDNVEFKPDDRWGLEKRFWTAYRRSANELYAPKGTTDNACTATTYGINDVTTDSDKLYKRNEARDPPNRYYADDGANLNEGNKIETSSPSTGRFLIDIDCQAGPLTTTTSKDFNVVVLAFDGEAVTGDPGFCIPRGYGVSGGACSDDDITDPTEPPSVGGAGDDEPICEEGFDFSFAWLVCAALETVDDWVNNLLGAVSELLAVESSELDNDELETAWSFFRNIASVLLVIIGLVMIIGQAGSKE